MQLNFESAFECIEINGAAETSCDFFENHKSLILNVVYDV